MNNKKLENSIKGLINLYTVVIGAALSIAVTGIIDPTKGLVAATPTSIALFIAFVVTLFPFVHGALRHLDDAYIENPNPQIKKGALVIDFALLFLHALTFLILALLLSKPNHFAWCLVALLAVDAIWGIFAHFAASSNISDAPEFKWTIINTVFVLVGASYLIYNDINLADLENPFKLAIPILSITIIRSLVDYILCRDFYFPN